jgi:hypothetical protein
MLGPQPREVLLNGERESVAPDDKLEFPINMSASDLARFLAKVALGYAVRRRGLPGLKEVFLREVILGDGNGALRYVGSADSSLARSNVPINGLHGLADVLRGDLLSVFVHLFRHGGQSLPIYEVIVGRVAG